MKSCTSRTVFLELLRITPLTLPSGSAATFSILKTRSVSGCEETVCESDGFGQKLRMKPTNTETITVRLWLDFDENVVMDASSYGTPIGLLYFVFLLVFRFAPSTTKVRKPPFGTRLSLDRYSVGGFVPGFVSL